MFRFRLKDLRELHGLSQKALADTIGEAQSSIGGWECGRGFPRYTTFIRIADYFRVSMDYLAGRTDVRTVADPIRPDLNLSNHERMVIRKYRELSGAEQAMICKQLDLPISDKT